MVLCKRRLFSGKIGVTVLFSPSPVLPFNLHRCLFLSLVVSSQSAYPSGTGCSLNPKISLFLGLPSLSLGRCQNYCKINLIFKSKTIVCGICFLYFFLWIGYSPIRKHKLINSDKMLFCFVTSF